MKPRSTELLLAAGAIALLAMGLATTFAPAEIAASLDVNGRHAALPFQLLGALCFGLGFANWAARKSLLGGIYGRPILLANTLHFVIAGTALGKLAVGGTLDTPLLVLAAVYAVFAVGFLAVLLGPSPVSS